MNCLAEAAQIVETTEERRNEGELHRVRGDLLNVAGDRLAAEQSYRQALAVTPRQRAKTLELRAATRLARLWRDQDKRVICSPQSTTGSPRASTRSSSKTPKRCSTSWW
jgi:hypothetical protein